MNRTVTIFYPGDDNHPEGAIRWFSWAALDENDPALYKESLNKVHYDGRRWFTSASFARRLCGVSSEKRREQENRP
jgi:hypothetical protein